MTRVPFQQVDVSTAVPFKGNPVAVVLEGGALSTAQMQAIAGWTPFRPPDSDQRARAAAALGVAAGDIGPAAIVDVGPVWFTLQLRDGVTVATLEPDMAAIAALTGRSMTGLTVFGFYAGGEPADLEVRSLAPAHNVPEDPVCGSGNGCVAAVIQREKRLNRAAYVSSQGRRMNRDGRVEVRFADDGGIWLGGHAVTCIEGTLVDGAPSP